MIDTCKSWHRRIGLGATNHGQAADGRAGVLSLSIPVFPRTISRMFEAGAPTQRRVVVILAGMAMAAAGMFSAAGAQETTTRAASRTTSRATTAPAGAIFVPEGWFAPPEPNIAVPQLPQDVTRAFIIPIREVISQKTFNAFERKIKRCRRSGAQLIILDIDTPGGDGGAMLGISDLLIKGIPDVYTVAYVNPEAISAGAVISLSCTEIVMAPGGNIGDSMPVMLNATHDQYVPMPPDERAKTESYFRSRMENIAEARGQNVALCNAMVTRTLEVWMIRNPRTRQVQLVNAAEVAGRVSNAPATTMPSSGGGGYQGWEYVRTVDDAYTIATLTTTQAVGVGLVRNVSASMTDLLKHYRVAPDAVVLEDTWSETLVELLTSPLLTSLLMLVGIMCIYAEFQHPGLVVPALIGAVCFGIIFGSHYLSGMAEWWDIALFALGVVLIVVELFTPTMGLLAILGVLCCIVGLLSLALPLGPGKWTLPQTDLDWEMFHDMSVAMGLAIIGAFFGILLIARYLPKLPVAGRMVLAPVHAEPDTSLANDSPIRRLRAGDTGTVESICKPIGKVRFGDDLVDAVTEGGILPPGAAVRVLRREGNQVIVEKA